MARFRLCGQLLGENSLYGYGEGEWPFVVREDGVIWVPDRVITPAIQTF